MNNDDEDELLNFLTDGLVGRQRDLITRSYYALNQGNPDSAPVHITNLLTACTRRIVQAPGELRQANTDFRKMLTEGRELEQRVIERVEKRDASVITTFKDEAARIKDTWRDAVEQTLRLGEKARDTANEMKPVIVSAKQIAQDVQTLKGDLKLNDETATKTVEEMRSIRIIIQENQALMKRQGKEARANWITIGLLLGVFLAALFSQLPWWGAWLSLAGTIGLLQWLSRLDWKFGRQ